LPTDHHEYSDNPEYKAYPDKPRITQNLLFVDHIHLSVDIEKKNHLVLHFAPISKNMSMVDWWGFELLTS
jgi:hypothetical protein